MSADHFAGIEMYGFKPPCPGLMVFRDLALHVERERLKRVPAVADFVEEGESARVFGAEHRAEFTRRGRVAEVPEYLARSGVPGVQQRTAPFGLVAQHPKTAAVVRDVGSFVLDVQLPGPDPLTGVEPQIVGHDVFEIEIPLFLAGYAAGFQAAQYDGSLGIDFRCRR